MRAEAMLAGGPGSAMTIAAGLTVTHGEGLFAARLHDHIEASTAGIGNLAASVACIQIADRNIGEATVDVTSMSLGVTPG